MITAGDLTKHAVGADIGFHVGAPDKGLDIQGVLKAVSYPAGMVSMTIDEMTIALPREKGIGITDRSIRNWVLAEPDGEVRGRLLDELAERLADGANA